MLKNIKLHIYKAVLLHIRSLSKLQVHSGYINVINESLNNCYRLLKQWLWIFIPSSATETSRIPMAVIVNIIPYCKYLKLAWQTALIAWQANVDVLLGSSNRSSRLSVASGAESLKFNDGWDGFREWECINAINVASWRKMHAMQMKNVSKQWRLSYGNRQR